MVELALRAAVRARGTASRRGGGPGGLAPVGFPPVALLVATLPWAAVTASGAFFLEEVFAAVAVLLVVQSAIAQVYPTSELGAPEIQRALDTPSTPPGSVVQARDPQTVCPTRPKTAMFGCPQEPRARGAI